MFKVDGNSDDILASTSLQRRQKLSLYNTIDDAVDLIRKSQNVLILTGAGISKPSSVLRMLILTQGTSRCIMWYT